MFEEIKFEIVELYIEKVNKATASFSGSLHVYLIDYDIDLRGISIIKKKNHWLVFMPRRTGIDPDTKEKVYYPLLSFTNFEKQKLFLTQLRKELPEFYKEKLELESGSKKKKGAPIYAMKKAG
jgi:hypothetical protein